MPGMFPWLLHRWLQWDDSLHFGFGAGGDKQGVTFWETELGRRVPQEQELPSAVSAAVEELEDRALRRLQRFVALCADWAVKLEASPGASLASFGRSVTGDAKPPPGCAPEANLAHLRALYQRCGALQDRLVNPAQAYCVELDAEAEAQLDEALRRAVSGSVTAISRLWSSWLRSRSA